MNKKFPNFFHLFKNQKLSRTGPEKIQSKWKNQTLFLKQWQNILCQSSMKTNKSLRNALFPSRRIHHYNWLLRNKKWKTTKKWRRKNHHVNSKHEKKRIKPGKTQPKHSSENCHQQRKTFSSFYYIWSDEKKNFINFFSNFIFHHCHFLTIFPLLFATRERKNQQQQLKDKSKNYCQTRAQTLLWWTTSAIIFILNIIIVQENFHKHSVCVCVCKLKIYR